MNESLDRTVSTRHLGKQFRKSRQWGLPINKIITPDYPGFNQGKSPPDAGRSVMKARQKRQA